MVAPIIRISEEKQVSVDKMMFLLGLNCQRNSPVEIFRKLLDIHVWEGTFVCYQNIDDN